MNRPILVIASLLLVLGGAAIILVTALAMNRNSGSETRLVPEWPTTAPRSDEADWLTHYRLTDQRSAPFDSAKLDGKVHVVSFFFASCPGPCFKQNTKLREICAQFAPQGVDFISITCDPETDTPSFLNRYAKKLDAPQEGWQFLTGKLDYIRRVAAEVYSVPLDKGTHVEYFLVIDKWGVRRGKFHWNTAAEIMAMKQLLPQLQAETSAAEPEPRTQPKVDDEDGESSTERSAEQE